MLRRRLALLAVLALCACGERPPMTRVVVRDAAGKRTRTLYRAGERYGRLEFGDGRAILVREPDVWTLDLPGKTAEHRLDAGPHFTFHAALFSPAEAPGVVSSFELGREDEFVAGGLAKQNGAEAVDGQDCDRFEASAGNWRLILLMKKGSRRPAAVRVLTGGKVRADFHYEAYDRDLAFDPGLFAPPKGFKVAEVPPAR